MIILIWTSVIFGILYLYFRRIYTRFSSNGVKQIDPIPFVGNMSPMILLKAHFIDDLNRYYAQFPEERFVGKYEFTNPVVVIRDLELIKKVAIKDFEHFLDHRGFTDETVEPIFARNLFSLKGEEWKDMRSTLSPAFTSSKIRVMVPFMEEVGNQNMLVLKKLIKENGEWFFGQLGRRRYEIVLDVSPSRVDGTFRRCKLFLDCSKTVFATAMAELPEKPFYKSKPIEVDCKDLTSRYANDVIATCAFGLKIDSHKECHNEFYEMGKKVSQFKLRQMIMFFAYGAFPTLVKWLKMTFFTKETAQFFFNLVMSTIRNREANNILRPDMIHLLMEAKKGRLNHDEKSKDVSGDAGFATVEESSVGKKYIQRNWTDNDLIAQAVLFFIAGFETVSSTMSFILHELALNPDVQERLAKEIKEDSIKNKGKIDYTSVQNLVYMDMVISEVLRKWPPGFQLERICTKDYNMGKPNTASQNDFILRKGEHVVIPVWAIHRNPEFFPDPEKFDPERFADGNKDLIKPMTYMPFGVGPRNCIGSRFALLELKMLVYQILLHMELSPSKKTDFSSKLEKRTLNLVLEQGYWLNFKIRQ